MKEGISQAKDSDGAFGVAGKRHHARKSRTQLVERTLRGVGEFVISTQTCERRNSGNMALVTCVPELLPVEIPGRLLDDEIPEAGKLTRLQRIFEVQVLQAGYQ